MIDVTAIGEPLVQFNPLEAGPLKHAVLFEKHAAGSEANVIIGISRLGFNTAFITKLGRDEFSKFILSTLKGEDVDVSGVKQIDGKNCAVFFVQRGYPIHYRSDVMYYRSDSATRYLSPEDLDAKLISNCRILHMSGITPALSDSCRETALEAVRIARRSNVKISFDTNYRRKLWTESEARPVLIEIARECDVLLTDPDDARILMERKVDDDPINALDELESLGPSTIVYKLGASRGLAGLSNSEKATSLPATVPLVDSIGAGDAVAAGFLSGYLAGDSLQRCLDMASCCSALTVMRRGDFENLPDRNDLEKWLAAREKGFDVDFR